MKLTKINSVVFDFAGTLCSEPFFKPLGQDALDVVAPLLFGDNATKWADPWMKGDLTSSDVAAYLSRHLPESPETILAALRQGCAELRFNPAVLDFAKQQRKAGRKTALVTANMDVFTDVVVPAHRLDTLFDVILNTADCRTLDKSFLWRKAFHILGPGHSFSSSLLIDDSPKMVTTFQSLGGCAVLYRDDDSFRAWLAVAEMLEDTQN